MFKEEIIKCNYSGNCECQCPLGGDETDDCTDCVYASDFHFVDGECVKRN